MHVRSGLRLNLMLGSALLAISAAPAYAKDADTAAPAQDAAAAPAAPADAAVNQVGLGEIVVTATKRETNLQKTPISISVLNTQALEDRHVQSLFNLADGAVPSLRVATFEARQSALTIGIRGIVPFDQNQTARDNGVSVYLDGVVLGKTQGLNAALFDIERIEVLKGPQGTLFGRNTEGGAVSLVTRAPTGVFDGRVVGGVGNYGSREGEIHLDLPSFYNIAIKLDGVYQHQDPTVKDPLVGSTGWNYYDRKGGRAAARWKPFDGFTADISYDYAKDDNTPQYSQLLNYNPNGYTVGVYGATSATNATPRLFLPGTYTGPGTGTACGGTINAGAVTPVCVAPLAPLVGVHPNRQYVADVGVPQQPSVDITHGTTINLKWKVAPWVELRSITAWRGVSTDQWDNSGGPERVTFSPSFTGEDITTSNSGKFSRYSLSFLRQNQFSEEFQAVGSFKDFDYVGGLYYYTEHANEYAATPSSNLWNGDGTAYTILSPIPPFTTVAGTPVTTVVAGQTILGAGGVPANIKSTNQGWQLNAPGCVNTVASLGNLCQFVTRDSFAHDHSFSVFGQVTYNPEWASALHLTLGGRWTKDQRHGSLFVVNGNVPVSVGGVATPIQVPFTFQNSISRFDPLINLAFDASRDIHLYAKYSTGFRAGGADDRSQRFNSFGPESVRSYEVGAKIDFWDHRGRLNIAGYIEDRKNTQFDFDLFDTDSTSPTVGSHLEQAINAQGTNHIRGLEIDGTLKPIRNLTLTGSYAYTYWDSPTATNPFTGVTQQLYIVYTPRNAASGAIDYNYPLGDNGTQVRFHIDGNYLGKQHSFEAEPTLTDKSFVVNSRISLADLNVGDHNKVTLSFWVRNLFDTTYVYRRSAANSFPVQNYNGSALVSTAYGGILGDYGNLNPPRTWGFEASAKF